MRSGSNLLERYINQYDGLHCHGELFNPAFIGRPNKKTLLGVSKQKRDANPKALIEAIRCDDLKNIPGFRIFREHNGSAIEHFLNDPACAKIILTRDPLESFVSLKIAKKTDQWLIQDESHRKTARIYLDTGEFEAYRQVRGDYSKSIIDQLESSNQQYFQIDFDQLSDISEINRLAKFLGSSQTREFLEQPIKRQNPGALAEKIENYQEIREAFDLPEADQTVSVRPMFKPETGTDLSRSLFCTNTPLIFLPMPSGPHGRIYRWMTQIDAAAPQHDFGIDAYAHWQTVHPSALSFTVLRHPVARAYDAFMRKIFSTSTTSFHAVREALQVRYGIFLPPPNVNPSGFRNLGYDLAAHRTAFSQFLAFIQHNLVEKTGIRNDGRWVSQSDHMDGYEKHFSIDLIAKEEGLGFSMAYLENQIGVKRVFQDINVQQMVVPFDLADIYNPEIEALTRAAYPKDYSRFAFKNWR